MPDAIFADHLLGRIDGEAASQTAGAFGRLRTAERTSIGTTRGKGNGGLEEPNTKKDAQNVTNSLSNRLLASRRHQCRRVAVAKALRSEEFRIARTTMDLLVGSVAGERRVQRSFAFRTAEAFLVPHRSFGQLLFGSENRSAATRTTLSGGGLNRCRVRIAERF